MWTKPKTLDDVLPDGITGAGIFGALQSYDVPWKDDNINVLLDIGYQGNRSGQKFISPLVKKMMAGDELDPTELNIIAQVIFSMFNVNWTKQWATMDFEYDPIENYHMTEVMDGEQVHEYGRRDTRTDNLTHGKTGTESLLHGHTETRTDNLTHGKTGTESLQHGDTLTDTFTNRQHSKSGSEQNDLDRTETTTPNVTVATDDTIYGFNSAAGVPAQSQERSTTGTETKRTIDDGDKTYQEAITETGSETHAHSGTDQTTYNISETDGGTSATANTGTDQTTYNLSETDAGTSANVASGSDTDSDDYTLTRSGNIGVTTSQQMIESERQLWIWNYFENVVFPDLDKVLTLPLY